MEEPRYWFPAKRYGWGWGFPCAWQGWAVLAGYFVLLAAGMWLIPPQPMRSTSASTSRSSRASCCGSAS